jgi:DNA invertase Pin-like site-specific DNA recombinase
LLCEFTEVESGKKNDRIELQKAIEFCKQHNAVLVIAKLDRLSRNAGFIFALRDAGIQFICCDIPDATPLTIGIFAVLAQHERETISKRTKDALKIAKERGVKLGTPNNLTYEDRVKGAQIRKENALKNSATERAFCLISTLRKTGESYGSIAKILNENSFKTARGGGFSTTQVIRIVSMYC